jgi:alpha/beta superfamily hydrolase
MMRFRRTYSPRWTLTLLGASLILPLTLLSACGAPSAATTPTATPQATATETPLPGTFYFTTDDGVTLNGKIVGQGTTAIIFSAMDADPKEEWADVAPLLAARGYMTLAYDYRGLGQSQGHYIREQLVSDLRAAVEAARAKGATKIVLMGSSIGGLVTAKVAATAHPAATVVLSAPISYSGIAVSADELRAIPGGKFFAAAERDTAYVGSVQSMYNSTTEPKEVHIYPGNSHGTNLFGDSKDKSDFVARLFAFLDANAPAK